MFAPLYLDYNATTPLDPRVLEAMLPYMRERFGNASSRHEYGRQARAAIDHARAQVATATGAQPGEVIFTSGGSEANNLFIKGAAASHRPGHIAIGASEHPCVREPARQLLNQGWQLTELPVASTGHLDIAHAITVLGAQRPALASAMLANNETGAVSDIGALVPAARASGTWLHTDAVQAFGKMPIDFRTLGVHAMTVSSHKIGGPQGAGALILSRRVEVAPLIAGGGHEHGMRSGTENLAAIVGFGVACELVMAHLQARTASMQDTRTHLEQGLARLGATLFGGEEPRLPNTSYFGFAGIDGETLVGKLDRAGFAVANGAACSSANPEPSRTLLAMGVAPEMARTAVRVSVGTETQRNDIDRLLDAMDAMRVELKRMTALAV